jgi:hypothetical protein
VAVTKKNLSNKQKGVLKALAILTVITLPVCSIASVGGLNAAGNVTTHLLKLIGFKNDMQLGIGIISLVTLLVGSTIMVGGYKILKDHNKSDARKAFRKFDREEAGLLLAIKLLLIQEAKKVMPNDDFRKYKFDSIQAVYVLKTDVDTRLFVDNEDVVGNKEKLELFNNFNNRLIKILGL